VRAHRPALLIAAVLLGGCASRAADPLPAGAPLTALESSYQRLRYWNDRQRLLTDLGRERAPDGLRAATVRDSLAAARTAWQALRQQTDTARLTTADSRALRTMDREARQLLQRGGGSSGRSSAPPDCRGPLPRSLPALTARTIACYGQAAERIVLDRDTLNRLEVLGLLPRTPDPARRRRLFLALAPVWRSVNGANDAQSPYRALIRLRRSAWGDSLSPIEAKAPAFGLRTAELEEWLTRALTRWRAGMPDSLLEPWDWYYEVGETTRRLTPRVAALPQIRQVNDSFYRSFGADPVALHVGYDLEARRGKYPVAYTDFGSRNRWENGHWIPGEPWVYTSYLSGGFDNLAELLHETGHAIHIAGIRTRPAYIDWPDNDTFTEALADLAALDLYEPAWQQQFLGDSVPLRASLRAKYASIVFDMAWALFEIRVHATPGADPNALWADVTSNYLGIRPHPEWSWWAMRGQLIDGPGYLVNYALGAFLAADMRAEIARRWGPSFAADPRRYDRLCGAIYRFGLELPSHEVIERFVGRKVSPDALLADLRRMARH
jgi:hypothetical protein